MSTLQRTSGASDTAPITQTTIDSLKASMVKDAKIYGVHVQNIYNALSAFSGHAHSYFDQSVEYNYGNLDGGTSSGTYTMDAYGSALTAPTLSTKIDHLDIVAMNGLCTTWKGHTHTYTDRAT